MSELDAVDLNIIKCLLEDPDINERDLGEKIGVRGEELKERIERLKREGIILGKTMVLDLEKMGFDITAIIEVTVRRGTVFRIEKYLAKHPNIVAIYDVTGHFDALVIARFRNRKELDKFLRYMLTIEEIERTNTHLVLNTLKETFPLDPRCLRPLRKESKD